MSREVVSRVGSFKFFWELSYIFEDYAGGGRVGVGLRSVNFLFWFDFSFFIWMVGVGLESLFLRFSVKGLI